MEKICPECGGRFVGRIDKIYCCDSCRSNHNNRIYRKNGAESRLANRILVRNRRLLEAAFSQGISSVNLGALQTMGFDPGFWTSRHRRLMRPTRYFCYEFSYTLRHRRIAEIEKITVAKESNLR